MSDYSDILGLSRPRSGKRASMSPRDRAAQFSSFAALTGFEESIRETGRVTEACRELAEGQEELLDRQLKVLLSRLEEQPPATVTWFRPDDRKSGGAYRLFSGRVKKIDLFSRTMTFTDDTCLSLDSIREILPGEPSQDRSSLDNFPE